LVDTEAADLGILRWARGGKGSRNADPPSFDFLDAAPGFAVVDQFGLVGGVDRLGEGVDAPISHQAADVSICSIAPECPHECPDTPCERGLF
jgi:hypothetical protein